MSNLSSRLAWLSVMCLTSQVWLKDNCGVPPAPQSNWSVKLLPSAPTSSWQFPSSTSPLLFFCYSAHLHFPLLFLITLSNLCLTCFFSLLLLHFYLHPSCPLPTFCFFFILLHSPLLCYMTRLSALHVLPRSLRPLWWSHMILVSLPPSLLSPYSNDSENPRPPQREREREIGATRDIDLKSERMAERDWDWRWGEGWPDQYLLTGRCSQFRL